MKKENSICYTGNAGGKTLAGFGLALRMLGHNKRIVIVQFLKGRKSGELTAIKRFKNATVKNFGSTQFVVRGKATKKDIETARAGLAFAEKSLKKKPALLVLDEINIALAFGLLSTQAVLRVLKKAPKKTFIVLTGRLAPKAIKNLCGYVTILRDERRPKKTIKARAGIEF